MKLYADRTGRRTAQVLGDVLVLGWVAGWAYAGRLAHDSVASLRGPADQLRDTGAVLSTSMSAAGDQLRRVPFVGGQLQGPFDQAAGTGRSVSQIGTDLAATVERWALVAGLVTALVPIVVGVGVWGVLRWRFVRRASAAQRFVDDEADVDLFALRALARQPTPRLARVSADPAGAWRRGDVAVLWTLADLELRDAGVRPPPRPARPGPGSL